MVVNSLDEVLFWENFSSLRTLLSTLSKKYYPHDPESYFREKNEALRRIIPTREEFIHRLEYYEEHGAPVWGAGRHAAIDDLDTEALQKSLTNSTAERGAQRAKTAEKLFKNHHATYNYYTDAILWADRNFILELTIGAGSGTAAVMRKMKSEDSYFGVDIDFRCAKNADGLAKHYGVKGLGVAASLWNLPFDDSIFSSVCCNNGLNECREVPQILSEAVRVLAPGGRVVLNCLNPDRVSIGLPYFISYGFTEEEALAWMDRIRIYAGADSVHRILSSLGCLRLDARPWENGAGRTLIYEKIH